MRTKKNLRSKGSTLTNGTQRRRGKSSPNEPLNPKGKASCFCSCHTLDGHSYETCCGTCWMFHGVLLRQYKNTLEDILNKRPKGKL